MKTQRLNATTFASPKVALDIIDAMHAAQRSGLAQYLTNRKGHRWLRVDIKRDDHGRRYYQFLDRGNRECGHIIRRAALTLWNLFTLRQLERLESQIIRQSDERDYAVILDRHIIAANEASPIIQRQLSGQKRNVNASSLANAMELQA